MTTRSQLSFTLKKHHLPLQVAGDKTYPQAFTGVKKVGNFVPFKSVFFLCYQCPVEAVTVFHEEEENKNSFLHRYLLKKILAWFRRLEGRALWQGGRGL